MYLDSRDQEKIMPGLSIAAPQEIRPEAKRKMIEKWTEAIDEAYHIGDTLIFLREYPTDKVAMDGRIQSENPQNPRGFEEDQRSELIPIPS
jgi:hypothetical protein